MPFVELSRTGMRIGSRAVPTAALWGVFIAVIAALGLVLPLYWVFLLTTVGVSAMIARSTGLLTGQLGIITLCQMSFAAIGGWVVSWLALHGPETPFPLLVVIGGAVAAPIGLLLGLVTSRIRGVELAVVTLGFAAALDLVLKQGSFPGVGKGISVLPAAPFDDPRWFFALAWALLIALQLALAALGRTRHGLRWQAVGSSERGAAALGVRAWWSKATAFGVGAFFAGVAGGMLAGQYGLLTTSVFTPLTSMVHLATAVLCGAALFSGALLAGAFGVLVPEILRRVGLPLDVGHALLALGAFDVLRRGNGGIAEQLRAKLQDRAFRDARTSCDVTSQPPERAPISPVSSSREPYLKVTGVTVDFGGSRALDRVDLTVRAGEVHALIGPNGAGKTTLVDVVTGFTAADEGDVKSEGASLAGVPAFARARHGIRRTFQQSRAVATLTVGEYLRLAAPDSERAERERAANSFGLPDPELPIRLLDVGSRRILEVAAALAAGPKVILVDEPAAGLGEAERLFLAERLRNAPREFGCAVLLIEHDMDFVRSAASHTTVLKEGRVIANGAVDAVLASPQVIEAFLGSGEVTR